MKAGSGSGKGGFEAAYQGLNAAQKKAVDTIEGPVMVIAGPGTGKTQILTLRIANILAVTDTRPEQVLALTFTEAAAHNMRRRLASLVGNSAYRVVISTFHGFCNDVIRRYPEDFPRIIGSKSITEIDQVSIVESIIEEGNYVLLKPFGDRLLYVRDIVSAVGELKREGMTPERFIELLKQEKESLGKITDLYHDKGPHKGKMKGEYQKLERKLLKNEELASIYARYQEMLFDRKEYDFSDMILEVLKALEHNPALLQLLQEEHQYVLVDEHQDTNNAQNRIIELLMSYHEQPNLFVVGDEKQAIFRFQGASIENFQYLRHRYPSVELITLTENYRSTQSVLDAADSLLPSGLRTNVSYQEQKILLGEFRTQEAERYFIAHDIKEKIDSGVPPEEIAVIYRNNKEAFPMARDLARLGIPHRIESDEDLFSQSDVRTLLSILRAINEYGSDIHVTALLHMPLFAIDPLDAYKVLRNAADRKKYSLYEVITDEALLKEIPLRERSGVLTVGTKLKAWVNESKRNDLLSFLEGIVRDSGLLEEILNTANASQRFEALSAFFDQVRSLTERNPLATLSEFFVYFETVKKHKLFIRRHGHVGLTGKVRLMTAHRSKGLEFSQVYIINAALGTFGGKIDRDRLPLIDSVYGSSLGDQNDEDERRLFYVALTRAREGVTITYARKGADQRELLPSAFIAEIKPQLIEKIDSARWDAAYDDDRSFQFAAAEKEHTRALEKQYLRELFEKQGLSPTALNNYLECPWKYFYKNLIRIPSVETKYELYGTAVHAALQDFFNRAIAEGFDVAFLLESFRGHLFRQPLSPRDLDELLEKGTKALSGWFQAYNGTWETRVLTERDIKGIKIDDNVLIRGKLDKIEFIDDSVVNVVDYKTGKPKTRNDILGKTKSSDGNYYRQLVFYKLLFNHYADGKYSMQSGSIDFIEPDEKGKYHKETFDIDDAAVAELTEMIVRVSDEIMNLSFWDKECGEKDCEFCSLRRLISQ